MFDARRRLIGAGWAGLSLALAACGGSTEEGSGGGTGGTGGTAGSGGAAGQAGSGGGAGAAGSGGAAGQAGSGGSAGSAGQSGDCDESDKLCPDNGSTCTQVVPGGFTVCARQVEEATACSVGGTDDCCNSSECTEGACYPFPAIPYCGGPQPPEMNVCASDLCDDDSDCVGAGEQFCAPRGVNNNAVRFCMPKGCTIDADCSAKAAGICAPVLNPCCNGWIGLFCVYPDGCRTGADCGPNQHCDVNWDDGTGECKDGGPMCPA